MEEIKGNLTEDTLTDKLETEAEQYVKTDSDKDTEDRITEDRNIEDRIREENKIEDRNIEDRIREENKIENRNNDDSMVAREYIRIIMKELEDTRQQLSSLQASAGKRKKNGWKGIAIFEMICLLGAGSFLGFEYVNHYLDTSTQPVIQQSSGSQMNASVPVVSTYRYVDNLSLLAKVIMDEKRTSFELSVEQLMGYEYLCFSKDNIKIFYRNEFDNADFNGRYRVMVDNGSKLVECDWSYDLYGDVRNLSPVYGNYGTEGDLQLLFLNYENKEDKIPTKISMMNAETLEEYEPLDLKEKLVSLFDTKFEEDKSNNQQVLSTKMTLDINSASYTYYISKEKYIDAVYYEESMLNFSDYAEFKVSESEISLNAPVYISESEFLGELVTNIVLSEEKVSLQGTKFGAYVEATQEDPGFDGVITPRTSVLAERVTINGKNNCRYLIPRLTNVELNDKSWENLVTIDGIKSYYEDGVKVSKMGIDVSKHQGTIDWKQVKDAGVDYAMIRIGYRIMNNSKLELDPMFLENIKGATEAGIPVGLYFFSQAVTEEEAVEEAKLVLDNIKDYEITYPIAFDTEHISFYDAPANNITVKERTDICIAFCEEIKAAGYQPMIYANTKWMIMGIDLSRLTEYDKWFAYYGDNLTFPYNFQMLQYSDTGSIAGINGPVDLNISFIDYTLE